MSRTFDKPRSCGSVRFLGRDGPESVCLQSRNSVVADEGEIVLSNGGYLGRGELFNGSPTSGPQNDRPPIFRRTNWMPSILHDHFVRFHTPLSQHLAQIRRISYAVPRLRRLEKFGSQFPKGPPKDAIGWLKNVSSPTRNRKFSAWPDEAPQFPHCSWHVRHEKDPKDAQNRIEAFGLIVQFQHIPNAKDDILQSALASLFPRTSKESIGQDNPNHESRGSN